MSATAAVSAPAPRRSRPARLLGFAGNLARWGVPARALLFGPRSLGDDLLCTAVLREARRRGRPFTMMTARPELFLGNADPARLLPIDDDYIAGLRRLGARIVSPYYVTPHPDDAQRDVFPPHHIIAEMCRLAGISGSVSVRSYLHLTAAEYAAGRRFPRQVALHSSGLAAAIPFTAKEWGPARFAEVARALAPHVRLIQLGSPQDPPLPVDLDLRGRTTPRETAAVLANSAAFIGLEGFLVHLARAVECPSVVILGGRVTPDRVGYSANVNLLNQPECAPCGRRNGCPYDLKCMSAIAPATVVAAARALLDAPPARPLAVDTVVLA